MPANRVIAHKEWAGAAQGKWDPGAIDMDTLRDDVQAVLDGGGVWDGIYDELMGV